jgi:hypothetical protein
MVKSLIFTKTVPFSEFKDPINLMRDKYFLYIINEIENMIGSSINFLDLSRSSY